MTATFVQPGDVVELIAPSGGVTRGTAVQIGNIIGVPAVTALVGVSFNLYVKGVFTVSKVSAQAWAEGNSIYWDDGASLFTTVSGGNRFAGIAVAVAANPTSTGLLRLIASAHEPGDDTGFHLGTSAAPQVDDTVNVNFVSGFFDSGAASGDSKGLGITLNATGVLQTFSTGIYGACLPSVQVRNPVGVQGDLIFGAAGWIQGLGYAIGGYLSLPAAAVAATGNVACVSADINAPASADVSAATRVSCIRINVGGDATGIATWETKGAVISLVGFTQAAGITKMISSTRLAELPAGTIGMRVGVGPGGGGDTMYYVPLVPDSEWN